MRLRYYQQEAVDAVWNHVRAREDNPCVVIPTGGGKTPVIGQLCKDVVDWKGRVAVVSHVKELLQQSFDTLQKFIPEVPTGVYSAGLKSRDLGYPVTVAGIQSVYDKAEALGALDIIIVDEAHRIPDDGEGMYRTFLENVKKVNPNVRLIGLTATHYRMGSGMLCKPGNLLNKAVFEIGVRELIVKGFLSPLKSKATTQRTDLSNVSIRGGEYAQGELQAAMTGDEGKVVMACSEIAGKTDERKSVLVFCTGIDHANMVARFLQDLAGEDQVRTVFGDTPDDLRAEAIASFKRGAVKFLVNVDVLTTGFDAPAVDAVAILRPTLSPGLFYQMVGRGFRLADGKKDCLVLDFGDNLFRHGPVDRMVITEDKKTGQVGNSGARFKECPKCSEVLPWSCEICLECGEKLPKAEAEVKHGDIAADRDALSGPEKVLTTVYQKHEKDKDGRKSVTLRVNYDCGLMWPVSEFLCFEHPPGFARNKALEWWRARSSEPVPSTIDQALETIRTKGIKEPSQLVLKSEGKYLRVEKYIDMTFKPDPNVWLGEKTQPVDDKAFTNIPF
jgi:DNA repair protein RadD